jgi:hypothetical protein
MRARIDPSFLLRNPDLVLPEAPWCCWLNNVELGILLLAQPWMAEAGVGRSDLERQLGNLGGGVPIGPLYFQRINRAVARLEKRRQLNALEDGRHRRYVLSPHGFAALLLNLQVLREDPTVDGAEFEMKRALVSIGNVVLERVLELPDELEIAPDLERWFESVDEIRIWKQTVMTDEVFGRAFSILELVEAQRLRIEGLLAAAEDQLEDARLRAEMLERADLSQLPVAGADLDAVLGMARDLATGVAPRLAARARALRYRAYLEYLDELTRMYSRELHVVSIQGFRRAVLGRGDTT